MNVRAKSIEDFGADIFQVRQATRIMLLRIYGILFLLSVLFFVPAFEETKFGTTLLLTGVALVAIAVFGRCWAIMHIGSRKNVELVQSGPYRYCRNPLYFFSILACVGCGFISQSIVLTIAIALAFLLTFCIKIREEERYLLQKFGDEYEYYRMRTPRLLPRIGSKLNHSIAAREEGRLAREGGRRLHRQLLDTLGILLLIPLVLSVERARNCLHLEVLVLL